MATELIKVNRAPVMTLWAAVVAERKGFDWPEALTLGKSVAGLNAQAKGQRLGIFTPSEKQAGERGRPPAGENIAVNLLGRQVPAVSQDDGLRATNKGQPIDPASVERYLEKKFGEALAAVRQAMTELADSKSPAELDEQAYALYESFRPEVPKGKKGWGAAGDLSLAKIRGLV